MGDFWTWRMMPGGRTGSRMKMLQSLWVNFLKLNRITVDPQSQWKNKKWSGLTSPCKAFMKIRQALEADMFRSIGTRWRMATPWRKATWLDFLPLKNTDYWILRLLEISYFCTLYTLTILNCNSSESLIEQGIAHIWQCFLTRGRRCLFLWARAAFRNGSGWLDFRLAHARLWLALARILILEVSLLFTFTLLAQ